MSFLRRLMERKRVWYFLLSELIVNKFCHTCHDTSQVIITQFTAVYKKSYSTSSFLFGCKCFQKGGKRSCLSSLFLCASSIRKMTALSNCFKTTGGTSPFRSFFSLYAVWFPAKSVFLSGIQNEDTERLQKMLIFFVYKEINYYMLHLLSCLDCCERLEQATREESKLCLIKSRIVKNRGTQRQFSEKYLFGRRFEI